MLLKEAPVPRSEKREKYWMQRISGLTIMRSSVKKLKNILRGWADIHVGIADAEARTMFSHTNSHGETSGYEHTDRGG